VNFNWFAEVFFFLSILMAGILFVLSVYAFAAPLSFAKWFSPLAWLSLVLPEEKRDSMKRKLSYSVGSLFIVILIFIQFCLGGFLITGTFGLWNSPFAIFFLPGGGL